ncbi:MAG: arginine--tRNA ligase [Candidatus Wildermuthbacteria bacterium RIFCSPLOWO2_01_FULL_47_18]|uniref:Arginine--tRNA ligase n=1 Tax=Candidatus Wildermuthbacteria bacterium RIFCSPLOWO2_01_FULL_47_18 TaxID=1802460 RepID=A0A1G2RFJ3_9BACT|nr:MAG: arginine--tRNA ligase [Candidatus Wildermuthbacteria bacterium RIFCSPLOWO2_01_FULL_47_18]
MIETELREVIEKAAGERVVLEHPANSEHGDYSTNIALVLAKKLNKDPREVAEEILSKVKSQKSKVFDSVQVAGPGFINFFLSQNYLMGEMGEVQKKKEKYGTSVSSKGKKVMVEFTDPNPFKEFHIGHLYSNIVGESLSRVFESQGALVKRANYQGDVGMHVAKAVWGMKKKMEADKLSLAGLAKKSLEERVKFLGQSYALGADAFERDESAKKEIGELNRKIFALDKEIKELYLKGRKWSLDYFEKIYKRLGTKFNYYYFESKVGKVGLETVKEGLKKGIFEESQGAVIFPGEKYGLHSRVFINSQGLPTYEAKELGLAPTKYKDFKYDTSVIVTGNEIIGYFKVLIQALKLLSPEIGNKTFHVSHGMVRLPEGKMSSRTGKILAGDELIDQVQGKVLERMKTSGSEVPQKEWEKAAEKIALAAIKYSLLRVTPGKDIIFDIDTSLSLEGDSGPYLQYTYARAKSILRKAKLSDTKFPKLRETKFEKEEMDVLRYIYKFPEVAAEAARLFSPNMVAQFAVELAQKYNVFYNVLPVLQAETKESKQFRLALTSAVAQLLQNSLHLLGISTLERM